jgi:hypothetical protein
MILTARELESDHPVDELESGVKKKKHQSQIFCLNSVSTPNPTGKNIIPDGNISSAIAIQLSEFFNMYSSKNKVAETDKVYNTAFIFQIISTIYPSYHDYPTYPTSTTYPTSKRKANEKI